MAKRAAEDEALDGNQAYLKRQRISKPGRPIANIEEIRSARQLQTTLAFDQNADHARLGTYSEFRRPQFFS